MNIHAFPRSYDPLVYLELNPDLAGMSHLQLESHYHNFGIWEGRPSSKITTRKNFIELIDKNQKALEIGPFLTPCLSGENISYADILSQDQLVSRAIQLGFKNTKNIPRIDYVLSKVNIEDIKDSFQYVLSSHMLEHTPDLIGHLKGVENLISESKGYYFLIIPDKRFCFDSSLPVSQLSSVLSAYYEDRKFHSLETFINHRAFTIHNETRSHWDSFKNFNDAPVRKNISRAAIESAVKEYKESTSYIDMHAWQFTPKSFIQIFSDLKELKLINFCILRVYSTLKYQNEFRVILKYAPSEENVS